MGVIEWAARQIFSLNQAENSHVPGTMYPIPMSHLFHKNESDFHRNVSSTIKFQIAAYGCWRFLNFLIGANSSARSSGGTSLYRIEN